MQKRSQPAFGERNYRGRTIRHREEKEIAQRVVDLRELNLSYREIGRILKELGVKGKKGGDVAHPEIVRRIIKSALRRKAK